MNRIRTWATPLTIGSFFLMAGTGMLMFCGIGPGMVTGVHEWCSWIFVFGTGGHIAANFLPFKKHMKSRWGRASVAVFGVVLVVAVVATLVAPSVDELQAGIHRDLTDAPLATLATLTHTTAEALTARLQTHGVSAAPEQTIRELAGGNEEQELHLLGLVFVAH